MNKTLEQAPHYFEFEKWRMGITTGKHTSVSDLYKYFIENIHNQQSLPSKPVGDVEEMAKEYAQQNYDPNYSGYSTWVKPFIAGYAAAPQKGGLPKLDEPLISQQDLEDYEKMEREEKSPSPSEAGDEIEIIDGYTQLAIDKRSLPKDGQHVKFMTENEEFHEGYFVGGDDIFHVTDSKFFFKWHVQQWKVI